MPKGDSNVSMPTVSRSESLSQRIERVTELPMLLLAFAMVPLLAASLLWELGPTGEVTVFALDLFVWAAFAVDLAIKIALAPDRWTYIRRHWLDVLVVAIPFIRPLRILRIIMFAMEGAQGLRRLIRMDYLVVYATGFILVSATIVTTVEQGSGSPLETFPNALWWSMVTATTVGYGDMVPVTTIGRIAGVVLMLGGIGLFGAVTANLASLLVRNDSRDEALESLTRQVEALRDEVARLQR